MFYSQAFVIPTVTHFSYNCRTCCRSYYLPDVVVGVCDTGVVSPPIQLTAGVVARARSARNRNAAAAQLPVGFGDVTVAAVAVVVFRCQLVRAHALDIRGDVPSGHRHAVGCVLERLGRERDERWARKQVEELCLRKRLNSSRQQLSHHEQAKMAVPVPVPVPVPVLVPVPVSMPLPSQESHRCVPWYMRLVKPAPNEKRLLIFFVHGVVYVCRLCARVAIFMGERVGERASA